MMSIGVAMRDAARDSNAAAAAAAAAAASRSSSISRVQMWGYLPAASPQRTPLLQPVPVPSNPAALDDPLKTVCNGGCGFGIAISESGKLNTWGSTTELGQCYLISGKQQEVPEPYSLPTDSPIVQAAGGWAHCVAVTGDGGVFTWGWSECVPSVKPAVEPDDTEQAQADDTSPKDTTTGNSQKLLPLQNAAVACRPPASASQALRPGGGGGGSGSGGSSKQTSKAGPRQSHRSQLTNKTAATEIKEAPEDSNQKKRKTVTFQEADGEQSSDAPEESIFSPPCLVNLDPGIKIRNVAAGGRHTLALSDMGHVWGWGYGGEGQLGLGCRMRVVSSPQHIRCFDGSSENVNARASSSGGGAQAIPAGKCIKAIACGGRHSAVVTDAGALLTFGWGLHGQVGQGSTEDELRPCLVSTMRGVNVVGVAAGLWHTLCICGKGDVYAFGGNQFGQLGVGGHTAEMSPRLIDAPLLEDESSVAVACGARHSVILTGSGKVFAWGWNKYGQLGLGDSNNRDLPVQVTMNAGRRAASVACGWWHTLAAVHIK